MNAIDPRSPNRPLLLTPEQLAARQQDYHRLTQPFVETITQLRAYHQPAIAMHADGRMEYLYAFSPDEQRIVDAAQAMIDELRAELLPESIVLVDPDMPAVSPVLHWGSRGSQSCLTTARPKSQGHSPSTCWYPAETNLSYLCTRVYTE